MKIRRKSLPAKMRSSLQKEINSACPICGNEDVEYFEAHHIDGDRSNTILANLLLLCSNCHSKITKGDISVDEVIIIKNNLNSFPVGIEVYKTFLVSENDNWEPILDVDNAYILNFKKGNSYPIFQFHFTNHSSKTIVLMDVELRVKHLFCGFGDLSEPCKVPKSEAYKLIIENNNKVNNLKKFDGVQIPSKQSYIFQLELAQKHGNLYYNLDSRMTLDFILRFNRNVEIKIPRILINTVNEKEGIKIILLQ